MNSILSGCESGSLSIEQKLELGLKRPDARARGHARGEGDDVAQRPLCLREASDDVELVLVK